MLIHLLRTPRCNKRKYFLVGIFFLFITLFISSPIQAASTGTVQKVDIAFDNKGKPNLSAAICVQVDKNLQGEDITHWILYINHVPFTEIKSPHLAEDNVLTFTLDRKALLAQTYDWSQPKREVYIEVGDQNQVLYSASTPNFTLIYYNYPELGVSTILILLLSLLFGIVSRKTDVLKRDSRATRKPYSLSRTLLGFWTTLIGICILCLALIQKQIPDIPWQILLLLGINVTTKVAGLLMNRMHQDNQPNNQAPTFESKGFLYDILCNTDGTSSIYRFQMIIFHLVFGLIFMVKVIQTLQLPTFSPLHFILLGISNGIYITSKWPRRYATATKNIKK